MGISEVHDKDKGKTMGITLESLLQATVNWLEKKKKSVWDYREIKKEKALKLRMHFICSLCNCYLNIKKRKWI